MRVMAIRAAGRPRAARELNLSTAGFCFRSSTSSAAGLNPSNFRRAFRMRLVGSHTGRPGKLCARIVPRASTARSTMVRLRDFATYLFKSLKTTSAPKPATVSPIKAPGGSTRPPGSRPTGRLCFGLAGPQSRRGTSTRRSGHSSLNELLKATWARFAPHRHGGGARRARKVPALPRGPCASATALGRLPGAAPGCTSIKILNRGTVRTYLLVIKQPQEIKEEYMVRH